MEYLRLTETVTASTISSDVIAVVNALAGKTLTELIELCHVAWVIGNSQFQTDEEIAVWLSQWEPWASDTQSGRETTVAARRTTLESFTT